MKDEQIAGLADAIYREKVLRARGLPSEKKMGVGPQLFAEACVRMRSGIRLQFPDANEEEVERILRERLDRLSKLHEHGRFSSASRA